MDTVDVIHEISNTKKPREREGIVRAKHFTHLLVQPKGSTRPIPCDYESGSLVDVGDRVTFLWVQASKKYIVSAIFNTPKTIKPTTGTVLTTNTDHVLHDNIGGEVLAVRRKATPVDDDLLFANDSADGYRPKSIRVGDLPGGGGGSIAVDDGTDTVDPTSQLSFDPAFFDVSDAGGGQALVTFVGTGGGGSISALSSDKKSLTSGDVAVTSTSFVDLDSSLDITLTTGARRCLVSWNLVVTSTGSQSQVDVEIDGARKGGAFGLLAASASGINSNLSGTFLTDVLTAGSHTFKLMVRVDGATSTYRANTTDNPAIFAVAEQANTQGGSGAFSPALIYDYTLPSDGTFDTNNADDSSRTGILQTYADLEIRIDGGAASGVTPGVEIFLNGDTNTAHYVANRQVNAGGFDPGSINEIGFVAANGDYDLLKIEVGGYAKTAYTKRMIGRSVTGTTPTLVDYWLYYNQVGAITRFQAHCRSAGNFQAGTRIRIYGIP